MSDPIGREPDQLTDLSDTVDAFVQNTEKVVLHEGVEHRSGDPKGRSDSFPRRRDGYDRDPCR